MCDSNTFLIEFDVSNDFFKITKMDAKNENKNSLYFRVTSSLLHLPQEYTLSQQKR